MRLGFQVTPIISSMTILDQVLRESGISRLPTPDEIAHMSPSAMHELERCQSAIIAKLRYRATIHVDCLVHRIMQLEADIEGLEAPPLADFDVIANALALADANPRLRAFLDAIRPPPRSRRSDIRSWISSSASRAHRRPRTDNFFMRRSTFFSPLNGRSGVNISPFEHRAKREVLPSRQSAKNWQMPPRFHGNPVCEVTRRIVHKPVKKEMDLLGK
jgi:hypothetical protein